MKDECPVSIDELRHDVKTHEPIIEEDPDVDLPNLTSDMKKAQTLIYWDVASITT